MPSEVKTENNKSIIDGESVFYGRFKRYTWRDEKDGRCFFLFVTKQKLLIKNQYLSFQVTRNKDTKEDETWFTMCCDGTKNHVPFFDQGTPVRITGYFKNLSGAEHWDFQISSIKEASIEETTAIDYLASFPGISYENAARIVKNHGADIFAFVQTSDAARCILRETDLSPEVTDHLISTINSTVEERRLFEYIAQVNIPYPIAAKAVKCYGASAMSRVKTNPYAFGKRMGLSFEQCDRLAKLAGLDARNGDRLRAAAEETIRQIGNSGHTYSQVEDFAKRMGRILLSPSFNAAITLSESMPFIEGEIGVRREGKEIFIFDKQLFCEEWQAAKHVLRLACASKIKTSYHDGLLEYAETVCGIKYGTQQRSAFSGLLASRGLKILSGGPGTGKTSTIKGMIMAYQKMYPDHTIKLCAPTGRAAQRMSESTGMPSTTIHRLLEYCPYDDTATYKDANNPINADLIIVDEVSMVDIELFNLLLGAVKSETMVILVGDIHQLESVGPGAVLHDLLEIDSNVIQRCILSEVYRQKNGSLIIDNSRRINEGNCKLLQNDDFKIIHTTCEEESSEVLLKIVGELHNPNEPFETQVLCPSSKGLVGVNNCNLILQGLLNPDSKGLSYGRTKYRVNDKILMLRNNYEVGLEYFNGDIGVIENVEDNSKLEVNIRGNKVEITRDLLDEMCLSYGMTIHKSQGSEFKNVVIVMPMQPSGMLVRNLFYTAVTRAKKKVIIINEGTAMQRAIKTDMSGNRKTLLTTYIKQLQPKYGF